MTIPAVLVIGLISDQTIYLGLDTVDLTLLVLTLGVSGLTFSSGRTNVLLDVVHLLLFLAYLMLGNSKMSGTNSTAGYVA